jgi:hypothetical protein
MFKNYHIPCGRVNTEAVFHVGTPLASIHVGHR